MDLFNNDKAKNKKNTNVLYKYTTTNKTLNNKTISTSKTTDANGNVIEKTERTITKNNGITTVKTVRTNGKQSTTSEFQYNISELENYVINNGVDKKGKAITDFKSIPEIRKKPAKNRTPEEKALLEEFNQLINLVTVVGTDYGVDPKHILSIIQEEVGFDGFGKRKGSVTGVNGKGYMQLTSAPIQDFLGKSMGKYKEGNTLNLKKYGLEVLQLLDSRGFKVQDAKTPEEKEKLEKEIMAYLKENKDEIFNIRLGTLILRYQLKAAKGNIQTAAKNYNGSKFKEGYGKRVNEYANKLAKTAEQQTKYKYEG